MKKPGQSSDDKIRALGCLCCRMLGHRDVPAEIHKIDGTDATAIPICAAHLNGTLHPLISSLHMDKRAFIAQFGTEAALLQMVRDLLEGKSC